MKKLILPILLVGIFIQGRAACPSSISIAATTPATDVVCAGATVKYTATVTGTNTTPTYTWKVNGVAVGTSATTYTYAPTAGDVVSCSLSNTCGSYNSTNSLSPTVNPIPSLTSAATASACSGGAVGYNLTSSVSGSTYKWSRAVVTGISNAAATNQTTNPINETLTLSAAYTTPITTTYLVTVTANACASPQTSVQVTVYQAIQGIAAETFCGGTTTTPINMYGTSWTNNNTAIGLAASGTGNIPAFTAVNTGTTPVTATITATQACATATNLTFPIIINPISSVNAISNDTVCPGATVPLTTVSGPVANTYFTWTNSNTAIGLAASGTGNIPSFTATNTGSSAITATITITPQTSGYAYMTDALDDAAYTIGRASNTLLATMSQNLADLPFSVGITASSDGSKVYIANNGDNSVSVVDAASNTVTATIPVGNEPWGIVESPNQQYVYCTNSSDGTISVISTATNTVTATIKLPAPTTANPEGIAISPDGSKLYVTRTIAPIGKVYFIKTATNAVYDSVNVGANPSGMIVSQDNSTLYVANFKGGATGNTISKVVLNTKTVTTSSVYSTNSATQLEIQGLALSPTGDTLYITSFWDGTIVYYNAASMTKLGTITLPGGGTLNAPIGISYSADGKYLYVSNAGEGTNSTLEVIDPNTETLIHRDTVTYPGANEEISYSFGNFVTGVSCTGTPLTYTITVNPTVTPAVSLAITSGSQTSCNGASVTFTATPTNGGSAPTYNFKVNGVSVQNTTSNTYTTTTLANGNTVTCVMTSSACASPATATSNGITMTINSSVSPAVSISASPSGAICAGTSIMFTATPTNGGTSPSYNFAVNGSSVQNSTSTTYTSTTLNNGDVVSCTITSNATCAVPATAGSNTITMSVNPSVSPLVSIGASPSGAICAGTSVMFTATPTNGGTAPTYNFKVNGTSVQSGASATYSSSALNNGDVVTCTITSNATCASPTTAGSNTITMSVNPSVSPLVSIGASPSGAICAGTSVMFTATPTNGGASPTYNFKVNGTSVQSGASATYSSSALNNGDAVTCAITSNAACASPTTAGSNSLAETVNPLPVFNYTETDVSCYGGANGEIAVSVTTGTFPYTYSVDGGATFPYSISPITGLAAATYSVVVSDANGCVSGATSVSVQQPSAALTAGASNTGPYSISQTIQLEGSASGGTGSYTYSWYDGATLVSNSQNPTITNATVGDAGTYNLTVTDANHCTASASTYVVVTGGSIYTWIGTTSTDWTFPANWSPPSPTGGPNSCAVDVVINAGGNQPVVPASTPVAVGNMQINANATLTLQSNLSVCKNWVGGSAASGTVVGTGIVVLNGSAAQTISGKTIFDELQLNNSAGAALLSGSEAGINTALDLQTGNFDATNGSLTFLSTSVTQAGIIDNFSGTNQGTLTGSITAQRYYASATLGRNQHLLGSPVSAPALSQFGASGTAGFVIPKPDCDETQMATNSPYGTVFSYHESYVEAPVCGEAQWKVETSGNATNGLGYSILKYGNGTLSLNGAANLNSSYTITGLTNSNWANMSLQNRELSSGWQLVSNPYLATLQINTTNPGFDNQIQVWNANGLYAGTYQVGMVGDDAVVSPFQAFMVHKTNAGGTASYTINASDRVRTAQTFFAQNDNELNIVAQNIVTGTLDQTMIAFNTHASDGFDPQYDANKFGGALNRHTLYSLNNNKWMARNVLNSVNTTSAVAVGFEPGATGSYAFNFNNLSSFDPTTYIYLEDKQANVMYNVRNGVYQFSADSADEWNRFVIHFTPAAQISTLNSTCTEKGSININQPGPANWNYTLSDQASNTIASGMLNELSPVNINVYAGAYTLVLKDNNNYTVTKAINVGGAPLASASFTAPAWAPAQTAINFVSTSQNAATYTWHFGDSTIITDAANVYYTYMQPGTYSVTLNVTSSAGCTSSITKTITVTSVAGIQPVLGNNELSIWSYKNRVYVDFSTLNEVDADIRIFNILGQQIANDRYTSNGLYQKEIDNIDAAYVIVSVKNEDSITTRKLFIVNAK